MKPYMPPTPENYQRVLRTSTRAIQMWAGCIWVPIYEVMTRKHLVVTLEENLEMAADIGIDATTSIDDALAAAFERHGPTRRSSSSRTRATSCRGTRSDGSRRPPRVRVRRPDAHGRRRAARSRGCAPARRPRTTSAARSGARRRSSSPDVPGRPRGEAHGRDPVPVRPLRRRGARAADARGDPSRADPRAVIEAFRALEGDGPTDEQLAAARLRIPRR